MYLRSLLVAGAVALRANALLVVPEVQGDAASLDDSEFMGILPLSSHTPYSQQIDLLCTECPFRETGDDGEVSWTDGARTSLVSPHPKHLASFVQKGLLTAKVLEFFSRRFLLACKRPANLPPTTFTRHRCSAPAGRPSRIRAGLLGICT